MKICHFPILVLMIGHFISLKAQPCTVVSDNFNIGGASHDSGFQENDPVDAIVTLSNGNFVIAWETRDGVDGDENGAFFRVFQEDGTPVTDVVIPYSDINASGTGRQGRFGPKVVALATGFVVGWESLDGPGDTGPQDDLQQDTYVRVYNNNGTAVSGSTRISQPEEEDQLDAILPLSTGGFVVLIRIEEDNDDNSDDHFFQVFNANGTPATNLINVTNNMHNGNFQVVNFGQSMTDLGEGRFVVSWEARDSADGDGNGCFFRIFNSDGNAVTNVVTPYADINPGGSGDQGTRGPRVITLANGNFVISWDSERGPGDLGPGGNDNIDVYFRVFNFDGVALTGSVKANDDNTGDEEILTGIIPLTGGNFVILYRTDEDETGNKDDFFVRVFTAAGVAVGSSLEISGGAHVNNFSRIQDHNKGFIPLNNGNFVVGWSADDDADGDDAGAYYRVFDATGASVSMVIAPYSDINTAGTGEQSVFGPLLTVLPNGFTIAWSSNGAPGDVGPGGDESQDVYHRVIDNAGNPLCGTTKTNAGNDAEEEILIALNPLNNGNFVVVYKDDEDDTGNLDDYFFRVIGGAPLEAICPTVGALTLSETAICFNERFDITVSGLESMAMSNNNDRDYGIRLVFFTDPTDDPYAGGRLIQSFNHSELNEDRSMATLPGFTGNLEDPEIFFYAILDPVPDNVDCRPFAEDVLSIVRSTPATVTAPEDLPVNAGIQTGLGGGLPVQGDQSGDQGVYSGPGVTDDGNGMTYSFDPEVAGIGQHIINYTYTNSNGCVSTASDIVVVTEAPLSLSSIGDINAVNEEGMAINLGSQVAVQGIVHCLDFLENDSTRFWIIEPNGNGISIFSETRLSDYVVTEGDEIRVEGEIGQSNGLLQIVPSSITVVSQDKTLVDPVVTDTLGEALESKIVTIELPFVDSDDIAIEVITGGTVVRVPVSSDDTIAIKVLTSTDITAEFLEAYFRAVDVSRYRISGIVAQEDADLPYNDHYFLYPCSEQNFEIVSATNEPAWAKDLKIYPNPTSNHVNINARISIEELRIIDLKGQLLRKEVIRSFQYTTDLSFLPKGMYQLQLISKEGMVNRSIVRQ